MDSGDTLMTPNLRLNKKLSRYLNNIELSDEDSVSMIGVEWNMNYGKRVLGVEAFITAYERMIDKAEKMGFDNLPYAKERQRKDIGTMFLDKFNDEYRGKIIQILESGKYIPQEILNVHDYRNNGEK